MPGEIKFSALATGSAIQDADIAPGVQSGGNVKQPYSAVATYVEDKITTAGNRYLSTDNYSTDNLLLAPDFTDLKTETDNHIADLSNPHETTMQQTYDQNQTVILDAGTLIYQDTSGVFLGAIDTKGDQFHAPIYHFTNGQSITLDSDSIDTIFSNDQAVSGSNSIAIQLESSTIYALNSTFDVWRNGTPPIAVIAPSGVTIDGVNNATINLVEGQYIRFIKTALNTFVSLTSTANEVVRSWDGSTTPVDVTAGSGIDITAGVISLTGTGAATAYGGAWVNANSFTQSYVDATTWKGIRVDNLTGGKVNFVITIDSSDQVYFQYVGAETAYFRIGLTNRVRTTNNTSPNTYNYSLGVDSGSGFVPIYAGNALMQFVTEGNIDLDGVIVPYNIIVQLNPNDKMYPIIQNRGDVNPTNNEIIVRYLLADFEEIGDIGGTLAGVSSLNGLTGDVGLTSANNSVTIITSNPNIDLSVGQFQLVSGTSQAMSANISYYCTNGSLTSLSLPTTCSAGSFVEVAGVGAGLFSITQSSGQQIFDGTSSTTVGATGHLDVSAGQNYSALKLICTVANTTFMVINSQGNFTPS